MATTSEHIEIDTNVGVNVATFTANGEYLVGGTTQDVRVWRVADGKQAARMPAKGGRCRVATSRDGQWIAGGTNDGEVFVWSAANYEQVFADRSGYKINDVDFSSHSTHLVSAEEGGTATIWDFSTRQRVRTLEHDKDWGVKVAKYSPQGDKVATATEESVRVWDSGDGRLLVDVKVKGKGLRSLLWRKSRLFVETRESTIKEIDAVTGSIVSELSVPEGQTCIALPQHGKFIAHSADRTITLWDTATRTRLGLIPHTHDIHSFGFSPDGLLLAIAHLGSKIVVKKLFQFVSDPGFDIDNVALDAWRRGQLKDAEALLSAAITTSKNTHHVLASRALVRARLGRRDEALVDAEESINLQRSLVGYIAKCVALVGTGEKDKGIWVCDIASSHSHSEHITLLLLIKIVALFMAGEHVDAISRMDELIADSANTVMDPAFHVVQAYMRFFLGGIYSERSDYERAIQSFQDARIKLGNCVNQPPLIVSLITGWKFDDLAITIRQRLCQTLFAAGRTTEAAECVLRMPEEINMSESNKIWASDFKRCCRSRLEGLGDSATNSSQYDEAISQYAAALSLDPTGSPDLLMKRSNAWIGKGAWEDALNDVKEWASSMLMSSSWRDTLTAAAGFMLEKSLIYQALCEHLEKIGCVADAVACFHQISSELTQKIDEKRADWTSGFKSRCRRKLESIGDSATNTKQYDEAIAQYTMALSLDPTTPQNLLVKRSKTYADEGKWKDALNDANEVVKLDPSSPLGYERKYAALLGIGYHDDAIDAFRTMLSEMSKSSDPEIRERSCHYVRPEQAKEAIRTSIKNAICDSPVVLINALSGRLCNKSEQATAFESTPAFTKLILSMTTHIDLTLIEQVVGDFYRYATFSHTWEGNEPLYDKVTRIVVYDLEASLTHNKLQMFCKIVRDEGFNWAWSDTCCIDKGDHFILQEALVSMFKWYERSALTIIYLCDIDQLAEIGALTMSLWNSRGWTLQEYHASKVVRIYTKDWTPYLGLTIRNHKESPQIISEMEKATGISAQALVALRPGLNDIREKLHLASTRRTTRVEDAAYSLLGIFSVSLPITYGEGDKALGRLLSQLLTSSGDTSILAWSGRSGSFNSCLPNNIVVFNQPLTSYMPMATPEAEMGLITAGPLDLNPVTRLYDQLNGLSLPFFVGQRMKLPCLTFRISHISSLPTGSEYLFRAQAGSLGIVDIKTDQDLSQLESLYLVNPWIDFLLDRQPLGGIVEPISPEDADNRQGTFPPFPGLSNIQASQSLAARFIGRLGRRFAGRSISDAASLMSIESPMEKRMRLLQFVARLRQPFGALLFTSTRRNVAEYRRVATESLITVQMEEITTATVDKLIQRVRVLDVL